SPPFGPPPTSATTPGRMAPGPSGRPVPPPEIWLVAGVMVIVGIVVLDPVLRYGFPLLPDLFSSVKIVRALSALVLAVFVLIGCFGAALFAVAVLLIRGSRVGRGLTCVVCGIVAFDQLIVGQTSEYGSGDVSATSVLVVLGCLACILLVTIPPTARHFFS